MSKTTITLKCRKCGSTDFSFPPNPKPNDEVTCAGCGDIGRYGEIMKSAEKQAMDQVTASLRNSLKGIKGIRFK